MMCTAAHGSMANVRHRARPATDRPAHIAAVLAANLGVALCICTDRHSLRRRHMCCATAHGCCCCCCCMILVWTVVALAHLGRDGMLGCCGVTRIQMNRSHGRRRGRGSVMVVTPDYLFALLCGRVGVVSGVGIMCDTPTDYAGAIMCVILVQRGRIGMRGLTRDSVVAGGRCVLDDSASLHRIDCVWWRRWQSG